MTDQDPPENPQYLSPEEMQQWLRQEIADSTRALELRVRQAVDFVTAYTSGQTTPEQADQQYWLFQHRWGEALPGTHVNPKISDEDIMASIDRTVGKVSASSQTEKRFKELFGNRSSEPGFSR